MTINSFIIGIDPGVPVTMALLNPRGAWVAHASPRPPGASPVNDVWLFADVIRKWKDAAKGDVVAAIEWVSPRPREGVVSVGRFMGSFWMAQAACAALDIPFTLISPRKWKPRLGLDDDKFKSIQLAKKVFAPQGDNVKSARTTWRLKHKKDHDFAEAALLAYFLKHHEPRPVLRPERSYLERLAT